jgi:hypothetical protein
MTPWVFWVWLGVLLAELETERRGAVRLAAEVGRAWDDGVAEGRRREQAARVERPS